jgi:hypothetical protein
MRWKFTYKWWPISNGLEVDFMSSNSEVGGIAFCSFWQLLLLTFLKLQNWNFLSEKKKLCGFMLAIEGYWLLDSLLFYNLCKENYARKVYYLKGQFGRKQWRKIYTRYLIRSNMSNNVPSIYIYIYIYIVKVS